MRTNSIVSILFLISVVLASYAGEPVSIEDDLAGVARTLKTRSTRDIKQQLQKIRAKLGVTEARSKRFALLLEGFVSLNMEGDIKKSEGIRVALAQEENLAEWEEYGLRILQAAIEGKQGKRDAACRSID